MPLFFAPSATVIRNARDSARLWPQRSAIPHSGSQPIGDGCAAHLPGLAHAALSTSAPLRAGYPAGVGLGRLGGLAAPCGSSRQQRRCELRPQHGRAPPRRCLPRSVGTTGTPHRPLCFPVSAAAQAQAAGWPETPAPRTCCCWCGWQRPPAPTPQQRAALRRERCSPLSLTRRQPQRSRRSRCPPRSCDLPRSSRALVRRRRRCSCMSSPPPAASPQQGPEAAHLCCIYCAALSLPAAAATWRPARCQSATGRDDSCPRC